MNIFTFGCSGEEQASVSGKFLPYAPGKKPIKFISAGADVVGGGLTEGFGQGAGIALGLVAIGSAFAYIKSHSVTPKAR